MVRCPVCDAATVTVVLDSKPHASCSCCGATWIQEGSWQRSIRPGPILPEDVIALPVPERRSRRGRVAEPPPEEQAIAT